MNKKRDFTKDPITIIDVRRWVMRDTRIRSLGKRAVIFEVLNFDGRMDKNHITISQKDLSDELGCTRKHIKNSLDVGQGLGYFIISAQKGAPSHVHIDWEHITSWVICSAKLGHLSFEPVSFVPEDASFVPEVVSPVRIKRSKENKREVEEKRNNVDHFFLERKQETLPSVQEHQVQKRTTNRALVHEHR